MFKLWQGKREELTDEELKILADEYDEANELFWELMEEYAIGTLGAKYYSEMK
jgi:type II secretory pathway predicted ATPase ExeA